MSYIYRWHTKIPATNNILTELVLYFDYNLYGTRCAHEQLWLWWVNICICITDLYITDGTYHIKFVRSYCFSLLFQIYVYRNQMYNIMNSLFIFRWCLFLVHSFICFYTNVMFGDPVTRKSLYDINANEKEKQKIIQQKRRKEKKWKERNGIFFFNIAYLPLHYDSNL